MTYEKPQIIVEKKGPIVEVLCGGGNKCNGPKDNHSALL